MIGACVRRGVLAGLLAGVAAGLVGLLLGEPALSAAVALEPPAPDAFPRRLQLVGLVTGTTLVGLAAGAVFGVLAAWAAGRVAGDAWTRSLKLGAAGVVALVVLPALAYPPAPPGATSTLAVGTRTTLVLGVALVGVVGTAAAWVGARQLAATRLSRPVRQTVVGLGVLAAVTVLLAVLPDGGGAGGLGGAGAGGLGGGGAGGGGAGGLGGELLWRYRLGSLATQATLVGGTAVGYGLLASRDVREAAA